MITERLKQFDQHNLQVIAKYQPPNFRPNITNANDLAEIGSELARVMGNVDRAEPGLAQNEVLLLHEGKAYAFNRETGQARVIDPPSSVKPESLKTRMWAVREPKLRNAATEGLQQFVETAAAGFWDVIQHQPPRMVKAVLTNDLAMVYRAKDNSMFLFSTNAQDPFNRGIRLSLNRNQQLDFVEFVQDHSDEVLKALPPQNPLTKLLKQMQETSVWKVDFNPAPL